MSLLTACDGSHQVILLRSGRRTCKPLPGGVWAIGTTPAMGVPLYFFIDHQRWLAQLRLSALRYRGTFVTLFGVDEQQLSEWFQHKQWPAIPWPEVAQGQLISEASAAGIISDPGELGFNRECGAIVVRPLDRPTFRLIRGE